jgi:hypothetical protein
LSGRKEYASFLAGSSVRRKVESTAAKMITMDSNIRDRKRIDGIWGAEFEMDSECNLAGCETTILELVVMYLSQRLHGAREREKENENGERLSGMVSAKGGGQRQGRQPTHCPP